MNLAPLTGIAFAINWLIGKLNLNGWVVKTTRMTTNLANAEETALAVISEKPFTQNGVQAQRTINKLYKFT